MYTKTKHGNWKGQASFFGFNFWDFKLVPMNMNLELKFALQNQNYSYWKCGYGTEKSSQTWKSGVKFLKSDIGGI